MVRTGVGRLLSFDVVRTGVGVLMWLELVLEF
jgi:hypothetical protein